MYVEKMDAPKSPPQIKKKKKYQKPGKQTENLMTFGALCNGTLVAGRKQTTSAPDNCLAGKLLS
jgi:hypothetical protein